MENGIQGKISVMVEEYRFGLMDQGMKDIGKKIKLI
jgi:hypothetical protein